MRPGMQSLLDLVQGHPQAEHLSEGEALNLLQAANLENILPSVVDRLQSTAEPLSPAYRLQLHEIRRRMQLSAFVWVEILKNTLRAFDSAAIPVIALKGPCLAERLYGDASLRNCHDLDLLVRGADHTRAEHLLIGLAFQPNGRADDYHRSWSRGGMRLELHHNIENPDAFDFDIAAAWSRACAAEFHGVPLRLLAPSDELFYLCLHAVRHRFERLSLILDLGHAFRHCSAIAADLVADDNQISKNILALGWMMAVRLDPHLPGSPASRLDPRNRARLQRLAGDLWNGLMQAQPPVLDWAAQHRFYLSIENPGGPRLRRRMHHYSILYRRLIEDDFLFAARFRLHHTWQVRMARLVRLLCKTSTNVFRDFDRMRKQDAGV